MLNNIVDNLEQCGQQNIVQCCFHQARTGCAFFAVYIMQQMWVTYPCSQYSKLNLNPSPESNQIFNECDFQFKVAPYTF